METYLQRPITALDSVQDQPLIRTAWANYGHSEELVVSSQHFKEGKLAGVCQQSQNTVGVLFMQDYMYGGLPFSLTLYSEDGLCNIGVCHRGMVQHCEDKRVEFVHSEE